MFGPLQASLTSRDRAVRHHLVGLLSAVRGWFRAVFRPLADPYRAVSLLLLSVIVVLVWSVS
jgi:hypothetical protein